jgi:hypothetical protein
LGTMLIEDRFRALVMTSEETDTANMSVELAQAYITRWSAEKPHVGIRA